MSFVDVIHQVPLLTKNSLIFDEQYSDHLPIFHVSSKVTNFMLDWDFRALSDKKLYYKQEYIDGSICGHNQEPRRTTVVYYCDQYDTNDELKIIDIMEPDYCQYHIKISSKYMCAKLKTLPKASTRLYDIRGESTSDEVRKLSDGATRHH